MRTHVRHACLSPIRLSRGRTPISFFSIRALIERIWYFRSPMTVTMIIFGRQSLRLWEPQGKFVRNTIFSRNAAGYWVVRFVRKSIWILRREPARTAVRLRIIRTTESRSAGTFRQNFAHVTRSNPPEPSTVFRSRHENAVKTSKTGIFFFFIDASA